MLFKPVMKYANRLYPAYEARSKDNTSKGILRLNVSSFPIELLVKTHQNVIFANA